jgi:FkbM family methyltransferase
MPPRVPVLHRAVGWLSRCLPEAWRLGVYRVPWLAKALRALLTGFAPAEEVLVTVQGGALKGCALWVDLRREKYYWLGTYEAPMQNVLCEYVRSAMVAYDVGAHIGFFSLLLGSLTGPAGKVFSFEPLAENYERLSRQLKANPSMSHVTAVPCAVSDSEGEATFARHASTGMGRLGDKDECFLDTVTVPTIALDRFVYEQGHPAPDFIKMDIEGGEGKAIHGMKRLLKKSSPTMVIETHGPAAGQEVWSVLRSENYRVFRLGDVRTEIHSVADFATGHYLVQRSPRT